MITLGGRGNQKWPKVMEGRWVYQIVTNGDGEGFGLSSKQNVMPIMGSPLHWLPYIFHTILEAKEKYKRFMPK